MNIFAKNGASLADETCLDLFNEPDFYSSGDHVRGQILISEKYWHQVSVEVFLVCEEHAELNPLEVSSPQYRYRRTTIAGETLEGEPYEDDDGERAGSFPFDLRILDDPRNPFLLPSFEVDSGDLQLSNSIRWIVEACITYKGKEIREDHEIVVIPSRPAIISDSLRLVRQNLEMRAYEPKSSKMAGSLLRRSQSFHTTTVSGVLSLPESELCQSPATLPLQLMVLITPNPTLLMITKVSVQLITIASVEIGKESSSFTVFEELHCARNLKIRPESEHVDLTPYVSGIKIDNTCSSFAGRWLKMRHRLQVQVRLESIEKRDYRQHLTLSTGVRIKFPALREELVDAPPQYTPSTTMPISALSLSVNSPSHAPNDNRNWTASQALTFVNQMDQLSASAGL